MRWEPSPWHLHGPDSHTLIQCDKISVTQSPKPPNTQISTTHVPKEGKFQYPSPNFEEFSSYIIFSFLPHITSLNPSQGKKLAKSPTIYKTKNETSMNQKAMGHINSQPSQKRTTGEIFFLIQESNESTTKMNTVIRNKNPRRWKGISWKGITWKWWKLRISCEDERLRKRSHGFLDMRWTSKR